MMRVQGQLIAGFDRLPVVDANLQPITYGCTILATVRLCKNGVTETKRLTLVVDETFLPFCALRYDDFCVSFHCHPELRVFWCEDCIVTVPATTPFYR